MARRVLFRQLPKLATKPAHITRRLRVDDGAVVRQQPDEYVEFGGEIAQSADQEPEDVFSERRNSLCKRMKVRLTQKDISVPLGRLTLSATEESRMSFVQSVANQVVGSLLQLLMMMLAETAEA